MDKLTPREPTPEMLEVASVWALSLDALQLRRIWQAMHDAAPNAPSVNQELLEALEDLVDTGFTGGPQGKRARAAIARAKRHT